MNLKKYLLNLFINQFMFKADGDEGGGADDPIVDPVDSSDGDDPVATDDPIEEPKEEPSLLGDLADPVEEPIEEFTLELGEGSIFSQEEMDKFNQEAKDLKLNKVQAEALLKSRQDLYSKGSQDYIADYNEKQKELRTQLKNDPEFGGEKFDESVKIMSLPVSQFGDADFNAMLKTEVGNQPALARFLYKLGNAMKSDDFVGKGKTKEAPKQKSSLENLYPEFFKDE